MALMLGWLVGLVVGGALGLRTAVNLEGSSSTGFANMGALRESIGFIVVYGTVFGLLISLPVLLIRRFDHIVPTFLLMLILVVIILLVSSILVVPALLIPFIPLLARYLTLRKVRQDNDEQEALT